MRDPDDEKWRNVIVSAYNRQTIDAWFDLRTSKQRGLLATLTNHIVT